MINTLKRTSESQITSYMPNWATKPNRTSVTWSSSCTMQLKNRTRKRTTIEQRNSQIKKYCIKTNTEIVSPVCKHNGKQELRHNFVSRLWNGADILRKFSISLLKKNSMGLRAVGGNRIKKRTHRTYVFEVIDEFLSGVDFFFFLDNQNYSVCFDACIRCYGEENKTLISY